ncbi:MAG: methyltransferase domain-containing protein [Rhodospirillales bacterium]|nr:methyltransferase domain-containing protein [Rhodospirillales bacterium]
MRDTAGYWISQGARVAWYLGQYLASTRARGGGGARRRRTRPSGLPTMRDLLVDLAALLRRDRDNIAAGLYRMPHDAVPNVGRWMHDARLYFADLPAVNARRRRGGVSELGDGDESLPSYYRRNFHYQTDGYLSARSAELYDHQVEVLFLGGAAAMRRQALVPLAAFVRRHRGRPLRLLDVGSGTGDFLTFVKDNWPDISVHALDLSRYYLDHAGRRLDPWGGVGRIQAAAEALPIRDGSVDIVTAIYLLHEVPDGERARIAAEAARVMRANGRLIVVDSLQYGDRPAYDQLIAKFPASFHEPFYERYARCDLDALFSSFGLRRSGKTVAFFSKILVYDKAAQA